MDLLPIQLLQTPSQTVGPYFAYGLTAEQYDYPFTSLNSGNMIDDTVPGERIQIRGKVFDGEGKPIPDAMIELWQADAQGKYRYEQPAPQRLFGRQGTGTLDTCEFIFNTIKPGRVGSQAPHINVIIFMRGQLSHVYTRLYFEDEAIWNSTDPVLLSVPEERRSTLLAAVSQLESQDYYQFDIHMQGNRETVFFDV